MARKGVKKQFWISEKHAKMLSEFSKQTTIPEVQIIRFLLDGYHPKEAPGDRFYDDMNGLLKCGENLVTIARTYRGTDLESRLREEANALRELRKNIMEKYLMPEKSDDVKIIKRAVR